MNVPTETCSSRIFLSKNELLAHLFLHGRSYLTEATPCASFPPRTFLPDGGCSLRIFS